MVISNVPGPQIPLYMNGAAIVTNFGMAPLGAKMGLFIGTPSYNGKITFCVTSARDIVPDIDFFRSCLRDSFEELKQISLKATVTKSTSKKSTKAKSKAAPKNRTSSSAKGTSRKAAVKKTATKRSAKTVK